MQHKLLTTVALVLMAGLLAAAGVVALRAHGELGHWKTVTGHVVSVPATETAPAASSPTLIPPVTFAPPATPTRAPPAPPDVHRFDPLCTPAEIQNIETGLATSTDARTIHAQWIDYIRNQLGGTPPPSVGDVTWHQQWVANYDNVIAVLQLVLDTCWKINAAGVDSNN